MITRMHLMFSKLSRLLEYVAMQYRYNLALNVRCLVGVTSISMSKL